MPSRSFPRRSRIGKQKNVANEPTDLLRALHAEANVASLVTNGNERLETGDLTGGGHLLNRHDLHHLVLQLRPKEKVDDLVLYWETESR